MSKLVPYIRIALGILVLVGVPALFILAFINGAEEERAETEEKPEPVAQENFTERQQPNTAITLPSEKDKRAAEDVVTGFVMEFHTMDVKKPEEYIKRSKKFMTKELYKQYDGLPQRGTLEAERIEVVATELLPSELQEDLQIWTVGVSAEQFAKDGTSGIVFTEYSIMVVKQGKKWLVDGVKINGA